MQKDYKRVWEEFNHNGQPHYGLAKLALEKGDIEKALSRLEKFEKVWNMVSANFHPIEQHPRTDDEIQPTVYLRTKEGTVYIGEWCPNSGYFVADEIVCGVHPAGHEFPGKLYNPPVEFAYKLY